MKKAIIMLAAMVLFAAPAMAGPMPPVTFHFPSLAGAEYMAVATVYLTWDGGWHGGDFQVHMVDGDLPETGVFNTFCVESQITFYPGATYYASIDTAAIRGNPSSAKVDLTSEAAWIYSQYRTDKLDGDVGDVGSYTDRQISEAIWWQQGVADGNDNLLSKEAEKHRTEGIGNVRVMNLWTLSLQSNGDYVASDVQSQLILVPAPAAIGLGLLGLVLVGGYMRRYA